MRRLTVVGVAMAIAAMAIAGGHVKVVELTETKARLTLFVETS